ncbi:MAG: hypothetical protein IKZ33_08190, partial [Lentisphaeria bacterium]|nr:hypothetical protein [Lentisphaeria bacterium]
EMFCYMEHGKVFLFRGIPAKWRKEAAFQNVKLPGGWMISADSKNITVSGPAGKTISVTIGQKEYTLTPGTHTLPLPE